MKSFSKILNIVVFVVGQTLAVMAIVTDNFVRDPNASFEIRLIIGLLLAILTIEVNYVINQLELTWGIQHYSSFSSLLQSAGIDKTRLEDLVRHINLIRDHYKKEALIDAQKDRILAEAVRQLKLLSKGHFTTYFWTCNILTEAVKNMESELIGLSPIYTTDETWWRSNYGLEFLEVNKMAKKKGRKITRIFVYKGEINVKDLLKSWKILEDHQNAATVLYAVSKEELERAGCNAGRDAMAVIDRRFVFWAETNNYREQPDTNYYSCDPHVAEKYLHMLETVKDIAKNRGTNLSNNSNSGRLSGNVRNRRLWTQRPAEGNSDS